MERGKRLRTDSGEDAGTMSQRTIWEMMFVVVCIVILLPIDGFTQQMPQDLVQLGKRLYSEGLTISGQPVQAVSQHDIAIAGKTAACVKCHRTSGFGSSEGGYYVPPITGPLLFAPRKLDRTRLFPDMFQQIQPARFSARLRQPHMRPAYTQDSLRKTLQEGVDPGGQTLSALMPHYQLSDEDVSALFSYLQSLSAQVSPGVDEREIHFTMLLSDNVPPSEREAVIDTMRLFVDWHNQHLRYDRARPNFSPYHRSPFVPFERLWSFSVLTLTGGHDTWGQQVAHAYATKPFFAIVSGLVRGEWAPIAEFCDRQKVPCLLPITDLPETGAQGGYSVYFTEGLTLEAKVLADYLANPESSFTRIVELAATDSFGEVPSRVLSETLSSDHPQLHHLRITYHNKTDLLSKLEALSPSFSLNDALVVWPSADVRVAVDTIRLRQPQVGLVVFPSRAMSLAARTSGDAWEKTLRFIEPHEISVTSHPRSFVVRAWMRTRGLTLSHPTLQFKVYYALSLLEAALMNIREDYHRDYLLERIERESEKDLNPGIYPRLALGPTQRFASKGALIVRVDAEDSKKRIAVSEWIVP